MLDRMAKVCTSPVCTYLSQLAQAKIIINISALFSINKKKCSYATANTFICTGR